VIAGGIESMTRVPMGSNVQGRGKSERIKKYELINQGLSAERIAEQWALTEQEINEFSALSQERALKAIEAGHFKDEILAVGDVDTDEGPRPGTTVEVLKGLRKVFKEDGIISAGTSSQMSDGASAVLIMSSEKAQELGIKPLAKIIARTVVGSDPTLMLTGPIEATKRVLEKANLTIEDIDTYEVNEAFAPVPIVWAKEVGADLEKLNPDGGAIALGHPLGATGTKLLTTMIYRMERENQRYGLIAICEGMGMANATIIEKL
jgi:acetyl-CoA acyltransferase